MSSKMNKEKIQVNTVADMLEYVAQKKHPFRVLIEWICAEKQISARQLAHKSGAFVPAALSEQLKKANPNPGFEMIHGIARVGGIPEQMVIDACLGRPFSKGKELEEELLREVFRKYQMIKPENRNPHTFELTLRVLAGLVDEVLEAQTKGTKR